MRLIPALVAATVALFIDGEIQAADRPAAVFVDVASDSLLQRDELPPSFDREEAFWYWAENRLADPDSVRELYLSPVYSGFTTLLPPIRDFIMCASFRTRTTGGGEAGRLFRAIVVREIGGKWRGEFARGSEKAFYREHCYPFQTAVKNR